MPHVSRFKKRDSDRSGFAFYERELLKDVPWKVAPEEYDAPPPSKKSLGGEGDVSGEPRANSGFSTISNYDVPTEVDNPLVYLVAATAITPSAHPFLRITGSNAAVNLTVNPQITAGREGQVLTLLCADSSVTLDDGTGVTMLGGVGYQMRSGDVSVFMYHTGGTTGWQETSRVRRV